MKYGEGSVVNLYSAGQYLSQFKSKNFEYIVLRKIREKVKVFCLLAKNKQMEELVDDAEGLRNKLLNEMSLLEEGPGELQGVFGQSAFNAMLVVLANKVLFQLDLSHIVQLVTARFLDFIFLVMDNILSVDLDLVSLLANQHSPTHHRLILDKAKAILQQQPGPDKNQFMTRLSEHMQSTQKMVKQTINKKVPVLVLIPVSVPGLGKSTLATALQQDSRLQVTVISSDQIRRGLIDQYLLKNTKANKEEAFQRTGKQASCLFNDTLNQTLQQAENEPIGKQRVIFLDRNHPPQGYSQVVIMINQMQFKYQYIQIRMVALIPKLASPMKWEGNSIAFDWQLALQCILRVICRNGHETIDSSTSQRLSILLMFFKLFWNSDIFSRITQNHTYLTYDFSPDHLSLCPSEQQAFQQTLMQALALFQQGNTIGPTQQTLEQLLTKIKNNLPDPTQSQCSLLGIDEAVSLLMAVSQKEIEVPLPNYFGYFLQKTDNLFKSIANIVKQILTKERVFMHLIPQMMNGKVLKPNDHLHLTSHFIGQSQKRMQCFSSLGIPMHSSIQIHIFALLIINNYSLIGLVEQDSLHKQKIKIENRFAHVSLKKAEGLKNQDNNIALEQVFGEGGILAGRCSRKELQGKGVWEAGTVQMGDRSYEAVVVVVGRTIQYEGVGRLSN